MATVNMQMISLFLVLGPAFKALHILTELVDGNTVIYLCPLHNSSVAEISEKELSLELVGRLNCLSSSLQWLHIMKALCVL